LFRREIDLADAPAQVDVWISADAAYRLYVNGCLVDRGPDDVGKDLEDVPTGKWMLNYRDLSPFFNKGRNLIAVEVFRAEALLSCHATSGRGGLIFEARLRLADGTRLEMASDESWRGMAASQWRLEDWLPTSRDKRLRVLCFDAAQEPCGWQGPGFRDDSWPFCSAVGDVWSPMVMSEIPPRLEALYPMQAIVRQTEGVTVPDHPFADGQPLVVSKTGAFTVRFDRVLCGHVGIRVRGGAGAILELQPNELNEPGFQRMNRMMILRLREGEQEIETPFYDSFSVINIHVRQAATPVSVCAVTARFISYPVSYKGSFECSDPALNRIWETTRWLTQLCLQTHHLDSPLHQEPIGDPGDYLIEALNTYYAFGEPWLARQDLRKYAWMLRQRKFVPFHISYTLLWLQMLIDYGDYTGDMTLWGELAPEVHDLLDTFASFRGPNGLLTNAPNYMFMDWVKIGEFEGHHPPAVIGQGYLTAFYYRALADGGRIARFLDDPRRAEHYDQLRDEVKRAYHRVLWDEQAGLYRDGMPFQSLVPPSRWLPADRDVETHTAQNNTLAVLYDLAPVEAQAGIMRRVLSGPDFNCQPYFMHFVLDALLHCGLFDSEALPQIRRWTIDEETRTFQEMWTDGDFSHAWHTTLFQLSARVLGVTPLEPGFARVAIDPHPGDLHWARGVVPTPHGEVRVDWEKKDGRLRLNVSVPPGVKAEVAEQWNLTR
jgi:hypothetical protein